MTDSKRLTIVLLRIRILFLVLITRLLIIIFIVIVLITPWLCSCNNAMIKIQHRKTLSSAYTHQGKYIPHNSIAANRNSIQKQNVKCSKK